MAYDFVRFWRGFDLSELLPYAIVFMDWYDGYELHGEGSIVSYIDRYELDFNDEYNHWSVLTKAADKSTKIVYQITTDRLEGLWVIMLNARAGGYKFNTLWYDKESFLQVLLEKIREQDNEEY